MLFKLAFPVWLLDCVVASNYFETYVVQPETNLEQEPSRNALKFEAFKWPRAEIPFMFDDASYGKF